MTAADLLAIEARATWAREHRFFESCPVHPNGRSLAIVDGEACSACAWMHADDDSAALLAEVRRLMAESNACPTCGNRVMGHRSECPWSLPAR